MVSRTSWRKARAISPGSAPLPASPAVLSCLGSSSIRNPLTENPPAGLPAGAFLRFLWREPVRRSSTVAVLAARRLHRLQRLQRNDLTTPRGCRRGRRGGPEVMKEPPLLPEADHVL